MSAAETAARSSPVHPPTEATPAAGGASDVSTIGSGVRFGRAAAAPAVAPTGGSAFLPLLLLALAVIVWFGVQSAQLALEYRQFGQARADLEPQLQAATRLRGALDAVASATAVLAAQGNTNARAVVEELRRRGVTIDPEHALKK